MCDHEVVQRVESQSPRMPAVVWICQECGQRFDPIITGRFRAWLESRRLRRDLDEWRNG